MRNNLIYLYNTEYMCSVTTLQLTIAAYLSTWNLLTTVDSQVNNKKLRNKFLKLITAIRREDNSITNIDN